MISRNSLYLVIAIYFVALLGIYVFQRNILYLPSPIYTLPQAANAPAELKELAVKTDDDLDLKGWYAPATDNHLTLVYFHGNGDSLRTMAPISVPYIAVGYGFLLAEYRGYSGMPGSPTEEGLYADVRAYIRSLIVDQHPIGTPP